MIMVAPKLLGGRKGDLKPNSKLDRHEIPSAKSMKEGAGVVTNDVPAVQLPPSVHSETYNFGGGANARLVRSIETKLIRDGNMTTAFKNGIEDLRKIIKSDTGKRNLEEAGLKPKDVEKGIQQMVEYFFNTFK